MKPLSLAALLALSAASPVFAASGLALVNCDAGEPGYCLEALKCGLLPEDRAETDVVVNARETEAALAETIHHEFRHVVAGDFGRTATLAEHGLPAMETAIAAAEAEARKNAAQCP